MLKLMILIYDINKLQSNYYYYYHLILNYGHFWENGSWEFWLKSLFINSESCSSTASDIVEAKARYLESLAWILQLIFRFWSVKANVVNYSFNCVYGSVYRSWTFPLTFCTVSSTFLSSLRRSWNGQER